MLAGVTLLAIAVPLNIGYAQIAGLPPTAGLYALVVPSVVFALMTTSRQVVASPDAATAALVASSLLGVTAAGSEDLATMAAAQAILGGIFFLLLAYFKLGFLANFLSKPILVGFVGGLAAEIMLSQVAKMLGVHPAGDGFFVELIGLLRELPSAHLWSIAVSAASVAVLLVGRRAPGMPWALLVLVGATITTVALELDAHGVAVLGEVPAGPPQFAFPNLSWSLWLTLIPSALALTMVTVAEGLLVIRSYAEKHGYETGPNRDLAAFGGANIASGLTGSFAVGSSTSRTAAMDQAGSRTQLPSLVLATGSLLLLMFGTALLSDIPSPAIGAIVAVAVARLIGIGELSDLWRLSRFEFGVAVSCLLGVLVLGPIRGILLAFVLSLINLTRRAASPPIDILHGEDDPQVSLQQGTEAGETAPGVIVVRFAAPIFFANSGALSNSVRTMVGSAPHPVRAFVFDLEAVTDVDVTGADAMRSTLEWLHDQEISVGYTRVRPELRSRLEHFDLVQDVREFPTSRAALTSLREK
ncbi:MAG TPA: SulP family inorganic anion transporter [Ornithinicoccus sp.]|nr:SulP family inorganic anion transporter [Ornithinicoccus sp.]